MASFGPLPMALNPSKTLIFLWFLKVVGLLAFSAFRRPKTALEAPKIVPRRPKRPPRRARDGLRGPQDGPRGAQDNPRGPRDGPKRGPREGPRIKNRAFRPERAPKGPKKPPRDPQEAPKSLKRGPKTAPKRLQNSLPEATETPTTITYISSSGVLSSLPRRGRPSLPLPFSAIIPACIPRSGFVAISGLFCRPR